MTAQRAIYLRDISDVPPDTDMWIHLYHSYLQNLEFVNTVNLYLSVFSLLCQLVMLGFLVWLLIKCWRSV